VSRKISGKALQLSPHGYSAFFSFHFNYLIRGHSVATKYRLLRAIYIGITYNRHEQEVCGPPNLARLKLKRFAEGL
jgi:hypothetical protein